MKILSHSLFVLTAVGFVICGCNGFDACTWCHVRASNFHHVLLLFALQFLADNNCFLCRLATYDLAELQIEGDGNCQVCHRKKKSMSFILYYFHRLRPLSLQMNAFACLSHAGFVWWVYTTFYFIFYWFD